MKLFNKKPKNDKTEIDWDEAKLAVKEVCTKAGHPVLMGTDFCKSWKRNHKNCFGCSAKIGCDKLCAFMYACSANIQIPLDFFDHWEGWEGDKKLLMGA